MLEYFTVKKIKQHRAAKKVKEEEEAAATAEEARHQTSTSTEKKEKLVDHGIKVGDEEQDDDDDDDDTPPPLPARPVLDRSDESFLQSLLSDDAPGATTSPNQVPDIDWPSDASSITDIKAKDEKKDEKSRSKPEDKGKGREAEPADKNEAEKGSTATTTTTIGSRFSGLFQRKGTRNNSNKQKHGPTLRPSDAAAATPNDTATTTDDDEAEVEREERDIERVLDRMNLSAQNNKVVSMSDESAALLRRFTQVFKDLANGVPTAYDDLVGLVSDPDGAINRGFEKLPSSMKKLVTQLPEKLTATIAPELLAAAAKSQGLEASVQGVGVKDAAKNLFVPKNLLELVTKPGALVGMLRAIVNALQARWPAFLGVNVLWSIALFLLMFVLWYCHKRGREARLAQEAAGADVDPDQRIEELPDDLSLPAPSTGAAAEAGESSAAGASKAKKKE